MVVLLNVMKLSLSEASRPSLGPNRGAGGTSVGLRPGPLSMTRFQKSCKTGLAVAHSSPRPARRIGGCLPPILRPSGGAETPSPRKRSSSNVGVRAANLLETSIPDNSVTMCG
jgi:hypothetical protein